MNQSQLPLVSVVIPHRGPDGPLNLCIEALRQQTYPRPRIEILIVLNEPMRRTQTFELEPNERLLWQPDYYSYAARNMGIEASKGSIIALTDSDTVPDPRWVELGVQTLENDYDIVAGLISLTFHQFPLTAPACYEKLFAFDQEKNVAFGRAATANLMLWRSTFSSYGLFDGSSKSGEDFYWTSRAATLGARLVFAHAVKVSHPARETFSEIFAKAKRVSDGYQSSKHPVSRVLMAAIDYVSINLAPPSRKKQQAVSGREKVLGYTIAIVIQAAKLIFLIKSLATRNKHQEFGLLEK